MLRTPVPQTTMRVVLAAVVGYSGLVLFVIAGTFVVTSLVGPAAGARPTTAYLTMNIAASFISAIAGGYLTARFAPAGTIVISVALAEES